MSDVLTDYVRQLSPQGEPPDMASYDEACQHLGALLVTELRRRGLWSAPPTHVGVSAGSLQDREAFDELLLDAYTFVFLERLKGLIDQAKLRDSIRGLVVLNLRHFLTERQRRADPLGYRIYLRLKAAIERLVASGRLSVRRRGADGEESDSKERVRINNRSTLSFRERLAPVADIRELEGPVSQWNGRLLPELVTAESRAVPKVVQDLAAEVSTLPDDGVQAFGFQSLAKALKDDARRRWHAVWQTIEEMVPEDGTPGGTRVRIVEPDTMPDRPRFRALVLACVERAIDTLKKGKRQRDLWTVWLFVRAIRIDVEDPEEFPSHSETSRRVGLPRERIGQLLDQLKDWVRRCFDCPGVKSGCPMPDLSAPESPEDIYAER